MKRKQNVPFYVIAILTCSIYFAACSIDKGKANLAKTTVHFKDSIRHYFAVPQGKDLTIPFTFYNTGQHPLAVLEVQTSCGCTKAEFPSRLIESEGQGDIVLHYNSIMNIGYTQIYVTVIMNTAPVSIHTLIFDVNTVPNALYVKDYEELYDEEQELKKKTGVENAVDGDETQAEKNYYTDSLAYDTY